MLIDLRNALMAGKRKPTAKDYVQDGLIAMWDGIENAGWGVHDPNATVWKDLSGNNKDLSLKNYAHFDSNSLVSANMNSVSALLNTSLPYATIEVCCFWDESRNASGLICFGNSIDNSRMLSCSGRGLQIYNGKYQFPKDTPAKSTIAGVYDGNSKLPYACGRLVTSTPTTNNWNFRTGTFGLSGSSNYSQYNFVGNYYCVRLYSRALTADEIAHNYAIDKARFGLP